MKEIGIARRVDELGRIVIPKTIRSKLKIRQGDVFEIFIEGNRLILQREEVLEDLDDTLNKLLEIISNTMNIDIVITDTNKCVYASSNLRMLVRKELPLEIIDMIFKRKVIELEAYVFFEEKCNYLMQPIIFKGDIIGSVIFILRNRKIEEKHKLMCDFINKLFINKLEV